MAYSEREARLFWSDMDAVRFFRDQMSYQLGRKRDEKVRHWSDLSQRWLLMRLRHKTKQLETALDYRDDVERIIRKAAHVANFAMMIADNARASAAEKGDG